MRQSPKITKYHNPNESQDLEGPFLIQVTKTDKEDRIGDMLHQISQISKAKYL